MNSRTEPFELFCRLSRYISFFSNQVRVLYPRVVSIAHWALTGACDPTNSASPRQPPHVQQLLQVRSRPVFSCFGLLIWFNGGRRWAIRDGSPVVSTHLRLITSVCYGNFHCITGTWWSTSPVQWPRNASPSSPPSYHSYYRTTAPYHCTVPLHCTTAAPAVVPPAADRVPSGVPPTAPYPRTAPLHRTARRTTHRTTHRTAVKPPRATRGRDGASPVLGAPPPASLP